MLIAAICAKCFNTSTLLPLNTQEQNRHHYLSEHTQPYNGIIMESLTLQPVGSINGDIYLPGSKSLSNRILLLSAMADGVTTITNLLDSDDVRHMLEALRQLGVGYSLSADKRTCTVTGRGGGLGPTSEKLFLGNAGTAMRPLCAALCLGQGSYQLTGEPRMEERPIRDLVDALRSAGAEIDYLKEPGYPPLRIKGGSLRGGSISIRANISSQFLTAVLMAAPLAPEDTTITIDGELVSKPYIDMTLKVLRDFGAEILNNEYREFTVRSGQRYKAPEQIMVEGDASSASYFLAAAAIAGGTVKVHGVGSDSIQGDKDFALVLEKMGATVQYQPTSIEVKGNGSLVGVDLDLNHIPDAAMTIAVAALFAKGTTTIRNIYNWRVKETDRLAAMTNELRKVGATVVEGEDYIQVTPPDRLRHAAIDTYNDHRMAMCFSLVALGGVPVTINDPKCVGKTFPDYFELFETICQK